MPEDAAPYETIRWSLADGVGTITLNRPESLNAMNATMRGELVAALKGASRDDAVRCLVITGEGRGFCSGADLRGGDDERHFRQVLTDQYNPLVTAIRELPKPVVAAVNGVAAGAGVSIALACDLVYASEDARFIQAFVKIGLVPDSGSTRTLVRALGRHRAAQLMFFGEPMSATEAATAGLVNEVFAATAFADAVREIARRLAAAPTAAIGLAKRSINHAEQADLAASMAYEAALQDAAGRTADHAEGLAAFADKRDPRFTGR
jgi:2-(1,2-epoxy-1,2-dihydrophenyl)acetyl-CoA isomerase